MSGVPYTRGLHEVGDGAWAWLQPDGGWGWSNAGLIAANGESLLVDTLFDLPLTREMLTAMRDAEPAAARIGTLVNTHSNGDHCNGNELVGPKADGAEIIASDACAEELARENPAIMAAGMTPGAMPEPAGSFFRRIFGPFEFAGIDRPPPTRTFSGRLAVEVGGRTVELIEVGPAHTRGDVIVHSQGVVYTGDILFIGGHPIVWAGPVSNWIAACDLIANLDPEVIVPGHGPVTDLAGVARVREYLAYLHAEARTRFDAGMPVGEAARDIAMDAFSGWNESERVVVNVASCYREFGGEGVPSTIPELFALMAELAR